MPNKITVKELYKKCVELEIKLDNIDSKNVVTRKHFTKLVWIMVGIEIINMIFNYLLISK